MGENNLQLFTPINISNVSIKNRIAMAPMGVLSLLNPDGSISDRIIDYYIERARADVGLIITGIFFVENDVEVINANYNPVDRQMIKKLTELTEAIHSFDAKIFIQLTAGLGRVALPSLLDNRPVSSSTNPSFWDPDITCTRLTTDDVEYIVNAFGKAAAILAEVGIDGIELHGHEGYLFDQFATAIWNNRCDKFGGDLNNRLQFAKEVLNIIKKQVGQDYPVQYRFGLKHYMKKLNYGVLPNEKYLEYGRDTEEGLNMAMLLEKAGFDSIHVDAGCYDSWYWAHPPTYQDYGCMLEMAAMTKSVVNIPVIAVGRLDLPEVAEMAIEEGKADLVAIGRGFLSDPLWAKKVKQHNWDKIRPCLACNEGCMGRIIAGKTMSCAVNPACGRERSCNLSETSARKKILIAGGGVAGMEAARVAATRKHDVEIYEKSAQLGGHLIEAAAFDFKLGEKRLLDWYKNQLNLLGVTIHYNQKVTGEMLKKQDMDVFIDATGSRYRSGFASEFKNKNVVSIPELLNDKLPSGNSILICGGGLTGCETALFLAQAGKKVTIVELESELLANNKVVPVMKKMMLLDLLKFWEVKVYTETTVINYEDGSVTLIDSKFNKTYLGVDFVVQATGIEANQELAKYQKSTSFDVYRIGDCKHPKNIMSAIWEAYEVARQI